MKKCILLFLLATSLVSNMFGQFTPGSEEKIAKYISGKSEEEIKTLFTSNGYTVNLLIKGYPECLDKYVFYADAYRVGGEEAKNFNPPLKAFTINKGRIETTLDKRLSCGIAFTLTAKNNLSTDCMIFVGTNGWAYIYQLYKFEKAIPMILDVQGMTFTDNMLRPAFSFYIVTDNNQKGENQNYNFSQFNNKLTCKTALLEYDDAYSFSDGLAAVKVGYNWGFINKKDEIVIPCIYEKVSSFKDNRARFMLNGKYGFLDNTGNQVIPATYQDAGYSFSEGLVSVKENGRWGFMNKEGKIVIPCVYDEVGYFSEGLASVSLKGKEGYIDQKGKKVIPLKYKSTMPFSENWAAVKVKDTYGYIDNKGKMQIKPTFGIGFKFADGLAKVKSTNGWVYGYVNKYGKEYIPIIYTNAGDFSEGAAYVEYNKKYGYLNTYGSYLIAPKYDYAYDFSEGYALVKLWNKYFFIDKSGNKLSPKE
ncbi:MAG: WG repeat-containing protein [Bacteroidales bacterium]|nr:WG repeat-containing protein [Bacteroidales bacterium]